jgi:hypothetical protein
MKCFTISLTGIALVAAFSSQALAQREDQFAWSFGGGATLVGGRAADLHKTGAHGYGSLGIGMGDSPWGIRFDGMYSSLGSRERAGAQTEGSARVFMLTANGLLNIYGSNTHVYGLAGLGGHWYNPDGSGTKAENDFMLQAGVGVWLNFANKFVEAKWANLYRALPDPNTGVSGKRSAQLYPITLGIIF